MLVSGQQAVSEYGCLGGRRLPPARDRRSSNPKANSSATPALALGASYYWEGPADFYSDAGATIAAPNLGVIGAIKDRVGGVIATPLGLGPIRTANTATFAAATLLSTTTNVDASGTLALEVWAVISVLVFSSIEFVYELGPNATTTTGFDLYTNGTTIHTALFGNAYQDYDATITGMTSVKYVVRQQFAFNSSTPVTSTGLIEINGVDVTGTYTVNNPSSGPLAAAILNFGARAGGSFAFSGNISAFGIWKRALSTADASANRTYFGGVAA